MVLAWLYAVTDDCRRLTRIRVRIGCKCCQGSTERLAVKGWQNC
jgi:hypothetical protein